MKKITFAAGFVFLAFSIYSQSQNGVTILEIDVPNNPAADPNLCAFGNSVEDVTLKNIEFVREVLFVREGISVSDADSYLNPAIRREWEQLKTRYVSVHIVQRYLTNDERIIAVHFLVEIYERKGNNYYLVATNNYK